MTEIVIVSVHIKNLVHIRQSHRLVGQIEYFWLLETRKVKKKKPDIHAKSFKEIGKIGEGGVVAM